jgi:hypothetical protein
MSGNALVLIGILIVVAVFGLIFAAVRRGLDSSRWSQGPTAEDEEEWAAEVERMARDDAAIQWGIAQRDTKDRRWATEVTSQLKQQSEEAKRRPRISLPKHGAGGSGTLHGARGEDY